MIHVDKLSDLNNYNFSYYKDQWTHYHRGSIILVVHIHLNELKSQGFIKMDLFFGWHMENDNHKIIVVTLNVVFDGDNVA